jgi:hypothetical protein
MEFESEDFPYSLCPVGRIHGGTHGCKESLLKVRKGKYEREHAGCRRNLRQREHASLLQVLLKFMLTYG